MEANVWYNSRNNTIEWQLKTTVTDAVSGDKTASTVDHTAITRVELVMSLEGKKDVTIDSDTDATVFDFTDAQRLIVKPKEKALPPGNYKADLIVYDAVNPDGIFWIRDRAIEVV